ncbi:hypothetical protein EMCRGX_G008543 [Ephydatia muelleri]
MLSFATCANVPVPGGRGVWGGGGGLVEVEGRVVWGGYGGVYMLDEVRSKWSRVADGGEDGGTLAVCGGRLVWVGGVKDGVMSKDVKELRGGRWSVMPDMLEGCQWSCVLSFSGGGMVVMGGGGDGGWLKDVQVFDGGTQTWHRGPSLPKPCWAMSAVVHGDVVFVMGGRGMDRAVWCADIRDLAAWFKTWPFLHYDEGKDLSYCVKGFKERKMKSRKILSFSAHFIKMTSIQSYYEAVEHDRTETGGINTIPQSLTTPYLSQSPTTPYLSQPLTTPYLSQSLTTPYLSQSLTTPYLSQSLTTPYLSQSLTTPYLSQSLTTPYLSQSLTTPYLSQPLTTPYLSQSLTTPYPSLAKLFPITPTVNETGKSQKEADERLYEEAMSKGYVETSVTKCLILGAAGVGKTHLKHLLLKKDPPGQRVSTGLADNPVRAISSLAGVGGQEDDWFVVEDDQALLRVVGGTIRDGGVSMATSLDEVVSSFPKMTIHVSSDGAGAVHPDPTPARVNTTMDSGQQSRTVSIEEELIHHINHSSDKKKMFGVKWIHFIDSGGQLQYHDILPLFIQKPAVAIFVLNLSEELSHQPTIEYYGADGKPVSRPYRSSLSHKQILQHCLGAMCSQDARPLIITVGTHRDAADRCSESIEEKSQKLKALLDAGSFRIVYNGEELEEVIFAVNGKTPQDEDRHVAKVLREEIISVCPQPIKMPIAWFGLEVLLQRSSHDGTLSLVECQQCAKRLHIEGDAFSAALHYLVHHNVFLHYPEVLPQTVFCDPQVVLTKVSELVEYHHKLLYRPSGGVAAKGDLVKFRDHGLLSVELLNKFSKHYTEGLFTPHDLLKLLVSVGAIAMVGDEGIEYLMPALLPHLDSGQVTKYCQPGTSLIIMPSQGCIPSGLFCCLVAQLLSPTNHSPWKVCMERGKPLSLYRNCITFQLKHTTELVTLVDMFSYILLHIDTISGKVCREVRGCVHSGIKRACGILKYQGVQFEDAFMCAGALCTSDPPHLATVVSEKKWKCSILGHQCGDLCEGQLMWFGESVVTKDPSATGTLPVTLDSEPSLKHLMEKVAAVIPSKCWAFGFQLGLTTAELQAICPQHQGLENHHRAFGEIFDVWRRRGSPPYTWRTLTGVLRSASVGEVLLSEQLTTWITQQ